MGLTAVIIPVVKEKLHNRIVEMSDSTVIFCTEENTKVSSVNDISKGINLLVSLEK